MAVEAFNHTIGEGNAKNAIETVDMKDCISQSHKLTHLISFKSNPVSCWNILEHTNSGPSKNRFIHDMFMPEDVTKSFRYQQYCMVLDLIRLFLASFFSLRKPCVGE